MRIPHRYFAKLKRDASHPWSWAAAEGAARREQDGNNRLAKIKVNLPEHHRQEEQNTSSPRVSADVAPFLRRSTVEYTIERIGRSRASPPLFVDVPLYVQMTSLLAVLAKMRDDNKTAQYFEKLSQITRKDLNAWSEDLNGFVRPIVASFPPRTEVLSSLDVPLLSNPQPRSRHVFDTERHNQLFRFESEQLRDLFFATLDVERDVPLWVENASSDRVGRNRAIAALQKSSHRELSETCLEVSLSVLERTLYQVLGVLENNCCESFAESPTTCPCATISEKLLLRRKEGDQRSPSFRRSNDRATDSSIEGWFDSAARKQLEILEKAFAGFLAQIMPGTTAQDQVPYSLYFGRLAPPSMSTNVLPRLVHIQELFHKIRLLLPYRLFRHNGDWLGLRQGAVGGGRSRAGGGTTPGSADGRVEMLVRVWSGDGPGISKTRLGEAEATTSRGKEQGDSARRRHEILAEESARRRHEILAEPFPTEPLSTLGESAEDALIQTLTRAPPGHFGLESALRDPLAEHIELDLRKWWKENENESSAADHTASKSDPGDPPPSIARPAERPHSGSRSSPPRSQQLYPLLYSALWHMRLVFQQIPILAIPETRPPTAPIDEFDFFHPRIGCMCYQFLSDVMMREPSFGGGIDDEVLYNLRSAKVALADTKVYFTNFLQRLNKRLQNVVPES